MNTLIRFALVSVALTATASSRAVDGKVPFRNVTFEAACQAATSESKLVFIDFYTTWCEPCKRLDAVTWTNPAVGNLLGEKTVALKIDAEKEGRELARRYKIAAYPTLLLLKADGTEVDRLVGFREPAGFKREFEKLLVMAQTGRTGLEQARDVVAQQSRPAAAVTDVEPEEAQPHFDLARKLIVAGKSEEALKELLWCWDEGKKDPEFARMRTSMVPRELGRLARDYPPARDAMVLRRDQARERALANKGGTTVIQELIGLNKELRMEEDTLAVFDQLPEDDRRRVTISIYTFDLLVEKKRYRDALLFYRPESATMMLESSKSRMKKTAEIAGDEAAASSMRFAITRSARTVECLAGAGRLEEARELAARILAFDGSDSTRETLRTHATRAGQPELLTTLKI
jgi:thiol-disulfide isomerase/thioredoxin